MGTSNPGGLQGGIPGLSHGARYTSHIDDWTADCPALSWWGWALMSLALGGLTAWLHPGRASSGLRPWWQEGYGHGGLW